MPPSRGGWHIPRAAKRRCESTEPHIRRHPGVLRQRQRERIEIAAGELGFEHHVLLRQIVTEPRFRISHAHQPPRLALVELGFELEELPACFAVQVYGVILVAGGRKPWCGQHRKLSDGREPKPMEVRAYSVRGLSLGG
jgi:hypothetical protein